jgi:hypothetical protein
MALSPAQDVIILTSGCCLLELGFLEEDSAGERRGSPRPVWPGLHTDSLPVTAAEAADFLPGAEERSPALLGPVGAPGVPV